MRRMRTWLILSGVAAAMVAGVFYAAANLDRYLNQNKDWISQRVEQAIGRKVGFDGVGLWFRGGLGVRIDNLQLADDPDFSDLPFLRAEALVVRVKILPALFGRYEISRIVLQRPSLTLLRNSNGLNAAGLAAKSTEGEPTEPLAGAAAIVVAYLEIEDGQVRFVDQTLKPPSEIVASRIDFTASDVSLDRPVSFRLRAAVLGEAEQNLVLEGSVGPVATGDRDHIPVDVELNLSPLQAESLQSIPPLAASFPEGLVANGPLAVRATVKGEPAALAIAASLRATDARVELADAFAKRAGVPLSLEIEALRRPDRIELGKALLVLRDAEITTSGSIVPAPALTYDLTTTSNGVDLSGWNEMLPALAGTTTGGRMKIALRARTPAQASAPTPQLDGTIELADLSVRSGALPAVSRLSTTIGIAKGEIKLPASAFDLGGSPARIEATVARIWPPAASLRITADALAAKALGLAADASRAGDVFRKVDVDVTLKGTSDAPELAGSLASASGTIGDTAYSDLVAQLHFHQSRAVLTPVSLTAFGGRLAGEGVYDFSDVDKPNFNFEAQADRVDVGKLLTWLMPGSDRILRGTLNGKMSLAGTGKEWPTIRDALVGGGQLDLSDGAIEDVNVAEEVLRGLTGVPGLSALLSPELRKQYPQLLSSGQTSFDRLTGALSIARGRIASDDLTLKARDYLLLGRGSVGLDKSVDFAATFEGTQQLTQALGKQVAATRFLADQAGRIQIPFRLTGTLPSVRAEPDMRVVENALKKAVAGSLVDTLLGSGAAASPPAGDQGSQGTQQEPLNDVIRKGLGGLLGQ